MSGPEEKEFEKLSFWELLQRFSVEIPIIQRDFAQGREGQKELRDRFLGRLREAVEGTPTELDFIYGDVKDGVFRPIDGQQRLTTLFLLHWYGAIRAELPGDDFIETLKKFSYETRISSRDFCKNLVTQAIPIQGDGHATQLSELIRDCHWYFRSWDKDPSVDGMLRMLDAIHEEFQDIEDLWGRLAEPGKAPISFRFVEMANFGLSDDLYIKMNARGRPLSAFENAKALLEKLINASGWEGNLRHEDRFDIKIDTDWTDCFWNLLSPGEDGGKEIDGPFLRFIRHSLACSFASAPGSIRDKERPLQVFLTANDASSVENFFNEDTYGNLYRDLELLKNHKGAFGKPPFPLFDESVEGCSHAYLDPILHRDDALHKPRVMLYAQLRFLERAKLEGDAYFDWLRVIRNIVRNTRIDGADAFISAIRLIDGLSEGAAGIYSHLAAIMQVPDFAKEQVREEIRKACLIQENPDQKEVIHALEDCAYCQGRIGFALDCVAEDENSPDLDFGQLEIVRTVIEENFSDGITPELRRALFTVDDGRFYSYWNSHLFAVSYPKYRMIKNDMEFRDYPYTYQGHRKYLTGLVHALGKQSISELLKNFQRGGSRPEWMLRLIEDPDLVKHSQAGYIAIDPNDECCFLIPGNRVADNDSGRMQLKRVPEEE